MGEQSTIAYSAGSILGFFAAFTVFCTVLTAILAFTHKTTPNPTIPILIAATISIFGYGLKRWLA